LTFQDSYVKLKSMKDQSLIIEKAQQMNEKKNYVMQKCLYWMLELKAELEKADEMDTTDYYLLVSDIKELEGELNNY